MFLNVKCCDACDVLSYGLVEMEEGERKPRYAGCSFFGSRLRVYGSCLYFHLFCMFTFFLYKKLGERKNIQRNSTFGLKICINDGV